MDDILASIRRILNEDETPATPSPAGPPAAEPLELTEAMLVASPPPPEPEAAPTHVALPADPEPEGPPQPLPVAAAPVPAAPSMEGLVAPAVAAATTAALGQLLRSVAAERQAPVYRSGPTIEDVVREELRPLLKEWLDQHLPPLVERLVRAEIERVVGRALP
ncbi:DUF2497 domain-containing protein [Falsiroseomonas ponticola]|uniref:DUF2497 domain-containing protein n=1 Tax=Falsiroseomonas ponticola TaxID=2786951 RepID=UPI00193344B1|nr:DUF2497 domain-containing protein [Roseomonas ponticola]